MILITLINRHVEIQRHDAERAKRDFEYPSCDPEDCSDLGEVDYAHDENDLDCATRSEDIASALISMLAEKVLDVTGGSGQKKLIWARVIAEFHAAYFDRFSERVEVDDSKPKVER